MKNKTAMYVLTPFEIAKVREFFNPKLHQVQMFTSSKPVAHLLTDLGYPPKGFTDEKSLDTLGEDSFYYFHIPEKFRRAEIQETRTISW